MASHDHGQDWTEPRFDVSTLTLKRLQLLNGAEAISCKLNDIVICWDSAGDDRDRPNGCIRCHGISASVSIDRETCFYSPWDGMPRPWLFQAAIRAVPDDASRSRVASNFKFILPLIICLLPGVRLCWNRHFVSFLSYFWSNSWSLSVVPLVRPVTSPHLANPKRLSGDLLALCEAAVPASTI